MQTQGCVAKEGPIVGLSEPSAFSLSPNPVRAGEVAIHLSHDGPWQVGIFELSDQRIRLIEIEGTASGAQVTWDGRNEDGRAVAAGTYWVRVESKDRVEARRVVVLP